MGTQGKVFCIMDREGEEWHQMCGSRQHIKDIDIGSNGMLTTQADTSALRLGIWTLDQK